MPDALLALLRILTIAALAHHVEVETNRRFHREP